MENLIGEIYNFRIHGIGSHSLMFMWC